MSETIVDELRREIAAKHSIAVGSDDPILVLVTANDFCMRRAAALLEQWHERALARQAQQFEQHTKRWLSVASESGSRTIELAASKLDETGASVVAKASVSINACVHNLIQVLQLAIMAAVCSSLLALLAIILLWVHG